MTVLCKGSEADLRPKPHVVCNISNQYGYSSIGFNYNVSNVIEVLDQTLPTDKVSHVAILDIPTSGVYVVLTQCFIDLTDGSVHGFELFSIECHLILFDVSAK